MWVNTGTPTFSWNLSVVPRGVGDALPNSWAAMGAIAFSLLLAGRCPSTHCQQAHLTPFLGRFTCFLDGYHCDHLLVNSSRLRPSFHCWGGSSSVFWAVTIAVIFYHSSQGGIPASTAGDAWLLSSSFSNQEGLGPPATLFIIVFIVGLIKVHHQVQEHILILLCFSRGASAATTTRDAPPAFWVAMDAAIFSWIFSRGDLAPTVAAAPDSLTVLGSFTAPCPHSVGLGPHVGVTPCYCLEGWLGACDLFAPPPSASHVC